MKLPSLRHIIENAGHTLRRFPLVIITAAVGTMVAIILLDHEGPPEPTILFKILFASLPGIPLLIAVAITAEKRMWNASLTAAIQILAVLLLVAYAWTVPSDVISGPAIHGIRLLIIVIAVHLAVAVAPYISGGGLNGFWHYNKTLFLRILMTGVFSAVLFAGLAIALAALDNLFGIEIKPKRYGELWLVIAGFFSPSFFLAGIPERLDDLEETREYPRLIKIFAQYILLPLVVVYFVILYAYLGKILIAWDWPKGWVSGLILGFATAGMFMHLLLYPVRELAGNVWIKTASRWFYVVMPPLVVMLLLAVWRRISEYGVTEGRYIGIAVGIWLAGIVCYFLLSKGKNIKIIPASLSITTLLISFGPWGIFTVSESSQVARLEKLLTGVSILVDGSIRPAEKEIPFEETKQISSILQYLHDVHGYDRIQSWFRESLRNDTAGGGSAYKDPSLVTKMMGIEYVRLWEGMSSDEINLRADADQGIEVGGYDRLWQAHFFSSDAKRKEISGGGFAYRVSADLDTLSLYAMRGGSAVDSIRVDMHQFVEKLQTDYRNANASNIPPEKMSMTLAGETMNVKLYVRHIYARRQEGALKIATYEVTMLYSMARDTIGSSGARPGS